MVNVLNLTIGVIAVVGLLAIGGPQIRRAITPGEENGAAQQDQQQEGPDRSQQAEQVQEDVGTSGLTITEFAEQTEGGVVQVQKQREIPAVSARQVQEQFLEDPDFFEKQVEDLPKFSGDDLAQLSPEQQTQLRGQLERSIPGSVKFSTSLEGAPIATGPQIKRDPDFEGEEITGFLDRFEVERLEGDPTRFEETLAREQARGEAIRNTLFGTIQNPDFPRFVTASGEII